MTLGDSRRYRIVVCRGPECGDRRRSDAVHAAFAGAVRERGVDGRVELGWQSCFGRCSQGPNALVRLAPEKAERPSLAFVPLASGQNAALYNFLRPEDAVRIVEDHVGAGRIVRDLVVRPGAPGRPFGGESK